MAEQSNPGGGTGLMDRVRESATSQLGAQKDRATDGIGSVAQAVRQSTQQLRDQQHETIAQYVEQAADRLERFASTLKDRDIGDLARQAQDLARRRPALFIGAAFALGLCAARFIKSSSNNGYARNMPGGYRDRNDMREGNFGGWPASPATDAGRI